MPKCSGPFFTIDNFGLMSTKRSIKAQFSKHFSEVLPGSIFQSAIDFLFVFCDFKKQLYIFRQARGGLYVIHKDAKI